MRYYLMYSSLSLKASGHLNWPEREVRDLLAPNGLEPHGIGFPGAMGWECLFFPLLSLSLSAQGGAGWRNQGPESMPEWRLSTTRQELELWYSKMFQKHVPPPRVLASSQTLRESIHPRSGYQRALDTCKKTQNHFLENTSFTLRPQAGLLKFLSQIHSNYWT